MLLLAYLIGFAVGWYAAAGIIFADLQGRFPEIAAKDFRSDLGFAVLFGFFYAAAWPLGLPVAYWWSGYAERGVWKVRKKRATER